jgi:general secretion pathway protein D
MMDIETRRGLVGALTVCSLAIGALCASSMPVFAAPPTRTTAPPTAGAPPEGAPPTASPPTSPTAPPLPRTGGSPTVELSGDEAGTSAGPNACKKWPANKKFTITIPRDAELDQLVQWMMTISCQKFIWNEKIRSGKVTILSPEKVSLSEAYAAFYAAIESMGLTVEPAGDYFKIVESTDAKSLNLPVYGDDATVPNNDRFVTQLVRVKPENVKDLSDIANKLRGKQGSVEVVGNMLIITDRGSVVRRLLKIIEEVDSGPSGSGEKIFFYQLQYADAEEVAQIIRDVFGEAPGGAGGKAGAAGGKAGEANFSRVIVDERTGTLIITTTESDYATILRLIQQLDVRLPGGGGRIRVKRLRNADPKEVATVLQTLISGGGAGGGGGGAATKGKSEAGTELFTGDVKITADEATRSLVIMASAADYKSLEPVIDELDRDRKQVYLEIYLLEASVGREIKTGAGAHFASDFTVQGQTGVGLVASAPSQDVNSLLLSPSALQGLAGGVLGPLIPGSGQLLGLGSDIPAFGVVIQAIQSNEDVNVVAEPHIYTADNKEAQIEVGRKVPTPGALQFGGAGGQGTSLTPLQSINREDVTLDIKVTPHIKDETSLTLDIELEDRDVVSQDPVLGVTTTKRRIKLENVLARDDLPVVLGGLMRERELENTEQVPGLGSVPILGWLFKRRVKTKQKINLLIIMIPHVVESADDIRRIHERRTRERYEFLERETSFKRRDLATNVNYRKKAGLLANIDREARRLESEEILLRQAEAELASERITGEIGISPRVEEGGGSEPAPAGEGRPRPRPPAEAQPIPAAPAGQTK